MPALLCYSVHRSAAQWTVYLHRQELSVVNGRFCGYLGDLYLVLLFYATFGCTSTTSLLLY